jgi:hypothetical protein
MNHPQLSHKLSPKPLNPKNPSTTGISLVDRAAAGGTLLRLHSLLAFFAVGSAQPAAAAAALCSTQRHNSGLEAS